MAVNVRKATVVIRECELTKKLLEQAELLDYTQVINRFGSLPEMHKHVIGWISGNAIPKRLDEWSVYLVINTPDGDIYLNNAHSEVKKQHKQLYI